MGLIKSIQSKLQGTVPAKKAGAEREKFAKIGAAPAGDDAGAGSKQQRSSTKKSDTTVKAKSTEAVHGLGNIDRVLLGPVVTEKATVLASSGKYVFSVNPNATKSDVRKAIAAYYGIRPVKIASVKVHTKTVRYGRTSGTRRRARKMIVTLPKGKTLDLFGT